ncbi:MAG: MBL fold metallo-hydrolase [Lachnospiraceae bacterium]|nr:MBL fold metallo-hydrolase [Lachnospiraceae bacterium]
MVKMKIQTLVLGMVATNCYFLLNADTKEMILVDPADEVETIKDKVNAMEGRPVAVLLTHGHYDHILAADSVRKIYQIPVYIHELDERSLKDASLNLSKFWRSSFTMKADRLLKHGDELHLADFGVRVLHTPGHTVGSACYYFQEQKALMSGDTMFFRSYGRTDFPTSSMLDMKKSIRRLLQELPDDTIVYPGHEMSTTIAMEKKYNPLA